MNSSPRPQPHSDYHIVFATVHRLALSLLGSYVFSWSFAAIGISSLVAAGIDFHEAETAMMLLALLLIVPLFLWAFVTASIKRVWLVLGLGSASMSSAAWYLQKLILS